MSAAGEEMIRIGPDSWVQVVQVFRRIYDSLNREGKEQFWQEAERMALAADRYNERAAEPRGTTHHGTAAHCPDVKSGRATRCPGHDA